MGPRATPPAGPGAGPRPPPTSPRHRGRRQRLQLLGLPSRTGTTTPTTPTWHTCRPQLITTSLQPTRTTTRRTSDLKCNMFVFGIYDIYRIYVLLEVKTKFELYLSSFRAT